MKNSHIISPITQSTNVQIVRSISTNRIIKCYKVDFDLDVTSYFNGIDSVNIIECKDTFYRFYYPPTILGNDLFYEELQRVKGPRTYYSPLRWEHEIVSNILAGNEKVIDVGCGSGNFLDKIKSKNSDILGLEYNNMAADKCRAKGLTVYNTNINEFCELKEYQFQFDVVCVFQVLEHIYEVNDFITSCLKLLRQGGKLIIGVPNNNPYLHKYDIFHTLNLPPHHIGLWNKNSLRSLQQFYPMKLSGLIIEPNFNFNYWLDIQAMRWLRIKNISFLLKRFRLNKFLSRLRKYTEGRNLLSVYIKS